MAAHPSNSGLQTVYDRLQVPSRRDPIISANQLPMSWVVAAYVPQPAVIWQSREPKRQPTDHAVLQSQTAVGANKLEPILDATTSLGQFQRRLKTSLLRLAYGRDLAVHS